MKANDLRTGNWVFYHGSNGPRHFLNEIDGNDIMLMETKVEYMALHEPIPLSEDWLVSFNMHLTIHNKDSGYKQYGLNRGQLDLMFSIQCNEPPVFYLNNIMIDIRYVHQLQNIYFALTGEELSIDRSKLNERQ